MPYGPKICKFQGGGRGGGGGEGERVEMGRLNM